MLSFIKLLTIFGIITLLITACTEQPEATNALEHAKKHLNPKYVCPMHPKIVRDAPGNCPICGMKLVKKEVKASKNRKKSSVKEKYPTVTINPRVVQNMGVRTAKVQYGTLSKQIKTVGYVTYDEDKVIHVHPRAEGWVEKLMLRNEGDAVEANQVLLEMYAPDILAAQVDVLISLQSARTAGIRSTKHRNNARNRLRLFNIPEYVIKQIETSGNPHNTVPVLSPQQGVVAKLNIREGMYVTPSLEMFTIADLSSIWVLVEVFEHQLEWIEPHLKAEIRVAAYPQKVWAGEVDYLYPELDSQTRTLKVRLRFANSDGLLKPNMFAQATVYGKPRENVLTVKREALIITGERISIIVSLGKGRFKPVDVLIGVQEGDEVEILAGLQKNQKIVLSGQFLIDSESNLQASFQRLTTD